MNLRRQAPAQIKRACIGNRRADWLLPSARTTWVGRGFGHGAKKVIAACHDGAGVSS